MNDSDFFSQCFTVLTGYSQPMRWQRRLYEDLLAGHLPKSCNLPTGLGKTSILVLWLIALTEAPAKVARRLVYIVNRRTVVDQATDEARKMRDRMIDAPELLKRLQGLCSFDNADLEQPLAISSLRGQFADNGEWRDDPARPAIIIGTVDMIGSRLLFGGYRCGFKSRPTHAALLGQDSLIIHDEAHLEHPFQVLLEKLGKHQKQDSRPAKVMALTATSRDKNEVFELTPADQEDEIVSKRITSKKGIAFYEADTENDVPNVIVQRTLEYRDSGEAILIFAQSVKNVEKIVSALHREKLPVEQLTGTLRGRERDEMASSNAIFARFLPKDNRPKNLEPASGTVCLACTSAGEVGVNISADHLVCDLVTYESMAQRLGRVNRFGEGDACVDVVIPAEMQTKNDYETSRQLTLDLLRQLPLRKDGKHDASPAALGDLPAGERVEAFAPTPELLDVDEILFDKWALTSIREDFPGRPPLTDWLHGVSEYELPQTQVAWRDEVAEFDAEALKLFPPEKLLEAWPLKPHELLRDRTDRVFDHLKKIANRHPEARVWIVDSKGEEKISHPTLAKVVENGKELLNHKTLILPSNVGGLRNGLLAGTEKYNPDSKVPYDVSEESLNSQGEFERGRIRYRTWNDDDPKRGFREVMRIELQLLQEERELEDEAETKSWRWFVSSRTTEDDEALSFTAPHKKPMPLTDHLRSTEAYARRIVEAIDLAEPERTAVIMAAKFHDLGKRRELWQKGIGNWDYPHTEAWAKSGHYRPPRNKNYRHEFGSLHDILAEEDFKNQLPETQDLILHLIAAHHGRGRPHFPPEEAFDPEAPEELWTKTAAEVPLRFARLERKYGRWGLAWLESLVRAADYKASRDLVEQAKPEVVS